MEFILARIRIESESEIVSVSPLQVLESSEVSTIAPTLNPQSLIVTASVSDEIIISTVAEEPVGSLERGRRVEIPTLSNSLSTLGILLPSLENSG